MEMDETDALVRAGERIARGEACEFVVSGALPALPRAGIGDFRPLWHRGCSVAPISVHFSPVVSRETARASLEAPAILAVAATPPKAQRMIPQQLIASAAETRAGENDDEGDKGPQRAELREIADKA